MNIAIQGHPTRGKEVIQILESLGGKKLYYLNASDKYLIFFIDDKGYISCFHHESPLVKECFKIYTLEEFEKEFPFKVGDIALLKGVNKPYEIIALEWYMNKLCYKLDSGLHYAPETLTTYKEMKEERNITLTLDKAKEWYKKGGELKEIALQAFNEKELNPLPRSWEVFCATHKINDSEAYFDTCSMIYSADITCRCSSYDKNMCPSRKSAEAHLAMIQLEQLRDCWRQGWEPNWLEGNVQKYVIQKWRDKISIETTYVTHSFLSFPTYEMAKEFLECFRDLIEKAGDLI